MGQVTKDTCEHIIAAADRDVRFPLTVNEMRQLAHLALRGMSAATVAEPSAEYHKQLTELADELDAELDSGAKWSKAQHTCNSVSIALREIAEKQAQALSKSNWMKRALEAEELNRKFMDRWNAENGPTHMGEPVLAAQQQQQAEPAKCQRCGADTADSCEGAGCGYLTAGNGEQQAEPSGAESALARLRYKACRNAETLEVNAADLRALVGHVDALHAQTAMAAQQQTEPKHATAKAGQHCVNCGLTLGQQTSWCNCEANRAVEAQQAEPVGDERAAFEAWLASHPYPITWRERGAFFAGHRAAQSGQRAGVAEGWRLYSADFSMNARNPANWGTVMLTRDDSGSKWWHALSDEKREKIDLFVSGRGTTFDAALQAANEKAAIAAPTQQQEGGK